MLLGCHSCYLASLACSCIMGITQAVVIMTGGFTGACTASL